MSQKTFTTIFGLLAFAILLFGGCSEDSSTNSGGSGGANMGISLSKYTLLVAEISPPEFSSVVTAKVSADDSMWAHGDYPLLGKVFSENEPMSLYSNIDLLDNTIDQVNTILASDTVSDSVSADGVDSVGLDESGPQILELTTSTTIPTDCQSLFGITSLDLDYMIRFQTDSTSDIEFDAAFKKTATSETYLTYYKGPYGTGEDATIESFVFYAYRNLLTDSIAIKGVFYKEYLDQTTARWIYDIERVDSTTFDYRMSWLAENPSMVACIIGGGDKDDEFALSYREYKPYTNPELEETMSMTKVFGPDYADGTSLSSEFSEYLGEDRFLLYASMPTTMMSSPWAVE